MPGHSLVGLLGDRQVEVAEVVHLVPGQPLVYLLGDSLIAEVVNIEPGWVAPR